MGDTPFPEGTRLAAYLRDSGGIAQELSVLQQERAVGEWAKHNSIIISHIFKDLAKSGLKVAGRDQFLEMMEYFAGKIPERGLVIWEYARFSRDIDDLQYYLADLRRRGYSIYSLNDQVPEGLEGRLLEGIIAWKNAKYSEDLRRNTIRGLRYVTSIHHANFTHLPFGYRRIEINIGKHRDGTDHLLHQLEIDPGNAQRVQLAYSMRATGATFREIHEAVHIYVWLNKYGEMLSNPIYIGVYHYGNTEIQNYCQPIIDLQTWNAVQEINRLRRERYGYNHPRSVRSNYILTGLLFCGNCGSRMAGRVWYQRKPYTTKYHYYFCQSENKGGGKCGAQYIPQDEIETRVIEAVKSRILDPDVLSDIYREAQAQQSANNGENNLQIVTKQQLVANNEKQITHLLAAIKDVGHSPAMLRELSTLEQRQLELKQSIVQLDIHPGIQLDASPNDLIAYIQNELANADRIKLARVLRELIIGVRATKDYTLKGEITYRLPGIVEGNFTVEL